MKRRYLGLCGFMLSMSAIFLPAPAGAEQSCDDNIPAAAPDERFKDNGDGSVTDRKTGLTWMRCSLGQAWNGKTCTEGKAWSSWFTWKEALAQVNKLTEKEHAGWRMPSITELKTLIEGKCVKPSINLHIFPETPAWSFWSDTADQDNADYAWRVNFADGKANSDLKSSLSYRIRLVKGEPYTGETVAAVPPPPPVPANQPPNWDDGIHDPLGTAVQVMQWPAEAVKEFPRDAMGRVDWVKTLEAGLIQPRAAIKEEGKIVIMDVDVLMKNTKEMPYVNFPHKTHTEWLACTNCHPAIFPEKAGVTSIGMQAIFQGQYCGICHGKVSFSVDQCERCHNVPHPGSPEKWW